MKTKVKKILILIINFVIIFNIFQHNMCMAYSGINTADIKEYNFVESYHTAKIMLYNSYKEIGQLIYNEKAYMMAADTMMSKNTFLYDHKYTALILICLFADAIIVLFYIIHLKKKNVMMIVENEIKLRNITNNINGGVVVLVPQREFQIIYANEGFLHLIQYSKEEFESIEDKKCLTYIHPEDKNILYNSINKNMDNNTRISISLRIKRKDGRFIPAKFSGTLAKSRSGEKHFYCVIMDISKEISMIKQLEIEHEKHEFLVKKSNEILYEINLSDSEILMSDEFEAKFGWTLSKKIFNNGINELTSYFRIYESDKKEFENMMNKSINLNEDSECTVRITKSDGTFRWCNVSQYTMFYEENIILVMGKIIDITEEVEEKKRMKELAESDLLTGLYNKEIFKDKCEEYMRNHDEECALVFVDLDNFKQINDFLGHLTGDNAIKDAAEKIKEIFGKHNYVARFGGDEFCAFVKQISDKNTFKSILEILVERMHEEYSNKEHSVKISASIGAAYKSENIKEFSKLLEAADKAVYYSKENGKDRFTIYTDDIKLKGYEGRK